MNKKIIGVLVGSLRKDAYSKKVANSLCALMPPEFEMRMLEIGDLPMFNQDYDDENRVPAAYTVFREALKGMDGFLFVTPEYNRSVPPVLKNALDTGSRPYGQNLWYGKPAGIVSVSPGAIGGFGANHHFRQSAATVNILIMPQPEAYISNADALYDANGKLNERVEAYLQTYANAFAVWVSTPFTAG